MTIIIESTAFTNPSSHEYIKKYEVFNVFLLMSLSNVLHESQLYEFKFYADAHIYSGAVYQGDLFKLVGTYAASQAKKALKLAHYFESQKTRTVISKKKTGEWYVWVEIRSLIEPTPLARLTIQDHQSALADDKTTSPVFPITSQSLMSA